jgi:hypothetical protein
VSATTIVGYATIDIRGRVPTFQTTVYPCLPTWPFSKVYGVPIRRSYFGTCAQAICERRPITCSNIATETGFDPHSESPQAGVGLIRPARPRSLRCVRKDASLASMLASRKQLRPLRGSSLRTSA